MSPEVSRFKICGITRPEDAECAVTAGAWAIGLIQWPGSPRRCSLDAAAEIATAYRRRVEVVGVFVNPSLDHLAATAEAVPFSMLQLHGEEGPAFCAEAARRTGCRVIKAARVRSGAEIQGLSVFRTDFHLLDSYVAGVRGGTGETFAWELSRLHASVPPVILSGGLTPENVGTAITTVRPYAVDVASGVEIRPGVKDPARVREFAAAVAAAAAPVASA